MWAALIALSIVGQVHAQDYTLPKVRAITGFIRLDRARYAQQITDTLSVLLDRSGGAAAKGLACNHA